MSCLLVFKECVLISFACRYPILSDMLLLLLCGRLHTTHECGSLLIFFSSGLHPAAQTVALDKYSDDEQEKKSCLLQPPPTKKTKTNTILKRYMFGKHGKIPGISILLEICPWLQNVPVKQNWSVWGSLSHIRESREIPVEITFEDPQWKGPASAWAGKGRCTTDTRSTGSRPRGQRGWYVVVLSSSGGPKSNYRIKRMILHKQGQ